ncbi:hypothetical protein [Pseudaestuariivita rosea]|uniref:hypothetical protein n=1 Tax=Pseudaestuariivita rosea TaxID=2763263 RepID=UPI001ABAC4DA|nr:hypothetical protein [Pseudaestuariivita rosea]
MIDNHLMLDAARAIYERGTQGSIKLREEVRNIILTHARQLPPDVPIILTDALANEAEARPLFEPTVRLAKDRDARLFPFLLELSTDENQRRLTDPARAGGAKLMDVDVLQTLRRNERLFCPDGAVLMDVTDMTAQQAADFICSYVREAR